MKKKEKLFSHEGMSFLDIETFDGMNQPVHPDIIKVEKDKYLMALTPYPFGIDKYENPAIYQSVDLKRWEVLSGCLDWPDFKCHFSDPTIVYFENRFQCYYRECRYDKVPGVTNIYVRESQDGKEWGEKEGIFSSKIEEKDILSPSINIKGNQKYAYFCIKEKSQMSLGYIENFTSRFTDERRIKIKNMPEGKNLWHVSDIPYSKEENILLITVNKDSDKGDTELYLGRHRCDEDFATIDKKILIKEKVKEVIAEYRATGLMIDDELKIICSVKFKDKTWGCILIEE